jgi:hypothetical protein
MLLKPWTRIGATYKSRKSKLDQRLFSGDGKWRFIRPFMLNAGLYRLVKVLKLTEGEHQIGRLKNMDKIVRTIRDSGQQGNIVEFGTYQGFSLSWLVYFRNKYGLKNTRVIGIDSFEGLPETSTVWRKGQFDDTSLAAVEQRLCRELGCVELEDENVELIQGWFDEPKVQALFEAVQGDIVLAHLDCDLRTSCHQALGMINRRETTHPWYLLLDDWGIDSREIPLCVDEFFEEQQGARLKLLSETVVTRYFEIQSTDATTPLTGAGND